MQSLKVLDLFSGIGGFSLGFSECDKLWTSAFCEIDPACRELLEKRFDILAPVFHDVKKLNFVKSADESQSYFYEQIVLREVPPKVAFMGDIDVITGGFPCQDISVAGLKKGLIDEEGNTTRSGLWFEYKRLIETTKPRWVVIENVRNLLGNGLATVLKDLSSIGYDAEWEIISARSVGAPHRRDRLWIVAYPAHTDDFRFWPTFATEEEKQQWWTKATASIGHWKKAEPELRGVDDGLSGRLDKPRKERIKQLGNAIVPQIATIIGNRILEVERARNTNA